jgi:hypothetical protein
MLVELIFSWKGKINSVNSESNPMERKSKKTIITQRLEDSNINNFNYS